MKSHRLNSGCLERKNQSSPGTRPMIGYPVPSGQPETHTHTKAKQVVNIHMYIYIYNN